MIFACLMETPLQHRGLPVNATPIRRRYCPSGPPLFQHGSSTNNSNGQTTEQSKLQSWEPRRSPGHRGLPDRTDGLRTVDRRTRGLMQPPASRRQGDDQEGEVSLAYSLQPQTPFNPTLTTSVLRKDVGNKGTQ